MNFMRRAILHRGWRMLVEVVCCGQRTRMGTKLLFSCEGVDGLVVGAEICEDLWTPEPPGIRHARNGATVLVNLSASNETVGKEVYRKALVCGQSARLLCGYVYADAGEGESTQDVVYSGHNLIAECGRLLQEASRFTNDITVSEIDVPRIAAERRRMTTFTMREDGYQVIPFTLVMEETALTRPVKALPFVPQNEAEPKRALCGDPGDAGGRLKETSGTHKLHDRRGRDFRRAGSRRWRCS